MKIIRPASLAFLLALACLLASCASLPEAPYAIHDPIITTERQWDECLSLEFQNRSDKDIEAIGLTWFLYDELESDSGETYEILLEEPLSARESRVLSVQLGSPSRGYAGGSLFVDALSAWLIRYADGTVWTDPWGEYSISSR